MPQILRRHSCRAANSFRSPRTLGVWTKAPRKALFLLNSQDGICFIFIYKRTIPKGICGIVLRACMHAYIHKYMHAYLHTYTPCACACTSLMKPAVLEPKIPHTYQVMMRTVGRVSGEGIFLNLKALESQIRKPGTYRTAEVAKEQNHVARALECPQ